MNYFVFNCFIVIFIYLFNVKFTKYSSWCENVSDIDSDGVKVTGYSTTLSYTNGTNQSQHSSEIKIFIKDPNNENNIVEYENTHYTSREESGETFYDYTESVKYMFLKVGEQEVWKYDHNKHNGEHPIKISYIPNKKLFVYFNEDFVTYEKRSDGTWKDSPTLKDMINSQAGNSSKPNMKDISESEFPRSIKLYAVDENNQSNYVCLKSSKYNVKQSETCSDLYLYEFMSDAKCSKIECDGKEVWIHDINNHGRNYPTSLSYNKKEYKLILKICKVVITYVKDNDDNWNGTENTEKQVFFDVTKSLLGSCGMSECHEGNSSTLSTITLGSTRKESQDAVLSLLEYSGIKNADVATNETLNLSFYKRSSSDPNCDKELTSSEYEKSQEMGDINYKFKDGVSCCLIKCDNIEVWKKGRDDINEPKTITCYQSEKKIAVRENKNRVIYQYKDNKWELYRKYESSTGSYAQAIRGTHSHRISLKQLTFSEFPKKVLLLTEDHTDPTKFLDLNKNHFKVYRYETLKEDVFFNLEATAKCSAVRVENELVWKKGDNNLNDPKIITYNDRSNIVTVMDNAKRVSYNKNDAGKWDYVTTEYLKQMVTEASHNNNLIEGTSALPVTRSNGTVDVQGNVSAEAGFSTQELKVIYIYIQDEIEHPKFYTMNLNQEEVELNSDKYTVLINHDKKNEFFYKFNDNFKCTKIKHKEKDVWKNDRKFEPKYVRYYKDYDKILVLDDNKSLIYSLNHNEWKLIGEGTYVSDNEMIELGTNEYPTEVKLYIRDEIDDENTVEMENNHYKVNRDIGKINEYIYEFKSEVKTALIKCENDTVWKLDTNEGHGKHPEFMKYDKVHNKIVLYFDNHIAIYKKDKSNNWNGKKIFVNFYSKDQQDNLKEVRLNATQYDLKEESDEYVFEIKKETKCHKVMIKGEELWKLISSTGDKYPKAARFKKNGSKFVLNLDDTEISFEKDSNGKWKTS